MATSAATTQQQRCISCCDEHVKVWPTASFALGFYLKAKKRNPTNRLCRLQLFPVQTASAERRGFEVHFCGCRVWNTETFRSCFHMSHMLICSRKHLIAAASASPVLWPLTYVFSQLADNMWLCKTRGWRKLWIWRHFQVNLCSSENPAER